MKKALESPPTASPAKLKLAVNPNFVRVTLLALYPGHKTWACFALGSRILGKTLGPTSAAAGTVKATEYVVVVPLIVAVPMLAVVVVGAVVSPSAGWLVLLCAADGAHSAAKASRPELQLNLVIASSQGGRRRRTVTRREIEKETSATYLGEAESLCIIGPSACVQSSAP